MMRFSSAQKDYYEILGISRQATEQEIKDAYRNLALKYHPDVRATAETVHEPSAHKFQEIAEAYAVLSLDESRRAYDALNKPAPHRLFYDQRTLEDEALRRRNVDGNVFRQPYKQGSFAEEKQKILAEERAKYNVDHLGRYKGGLPVKGKGQIRKGPHGETLGIPGEAHDSLVHQMLQNQGTIMDYQQVTVETAEMFSAQKMMDKQIIQRRSPAFIAKVDYEFFKYNHWRYGFRWFRNIFLLTFGIAFYIKLFNTYGIRDLHHQYLDFVAKNPEQRNLETSSGLRKINVVERDNGMLVIQLSGHKQHAQHH